MKLNLLLIVLLVFNFQNVYNHVVNPKTLEIQDQKNRFREKDPVNSEKIVFGNDIKVGFLDRSCHLDIEILWKSELGTPVYNTPLITDLYSDGKKEIVIATSAHYIEAIDGRGNKAQGWPFAFGSSSFISNPILYDVDWDGTAEIVVTTENGEIVFLGVNGLPIKGKTLIVPPLQVRKDWYDGLDDPGVEVFLNLGGNQQWKKKDDELPLKDSDNLSTMRKILEDVLNENNSLNTKDLNQEEKVFKGFEGWLTDEGIQSLELFLPSSTPENFITHLRQEEDPLNSNQFTEYLRNNPKDTSKKYVYIDAHVLHTPVIVDLDKDGDDEMIVPVSYYFDPNVYADSIKLKELDLDVKISKYIASGIVVFDLATLKIKYITSLDLTTDNNHYSAYMYASPTIVDLDADGELDILVATGAGFVYRINGASGEIINNKNWPLATDSIFASVVVEDLNDDGKLEIIVTDTNANLVCFDIEGEVLWEHRISGYSNQNPIIGDIDGDKILDVIVGTTEGHIWAVRGDNGIDLPNFPIKLRGRIQSQPILVHLNEELESLHIVVAAQDGHVYIIEGKTGCIEKIDIGESSFSTILADDINGNGLLDLIVITRGGIIYCLSTQSKYHPLNSWTSQNLGRNGFTHRKYYQGVYVSELTREHRDISGSSFSVQFEIIDRRNAIEKASYQVKISSGNEILFQQNYKVPGIYVETLSCPNRGMFSLLQVEMTNEHGQSYFDSFSVSFNIHFHRLLKYFLALPFLIVCILLLFLNDAKSPLPS